MDTSLFLLVGKKCRSAKKLLTRENGCRGPQMRAPNNRRRDAIAAGKPNAGKKRRL